MIVRGGTAESFFEHRRQIQPGYRSWTARHHRRALTPNNHSVIWTGSQMIIWGGVNWAGFLNTGGRYDPCVYG